MSTNPSDREISERRAESCRQLDHWFKHHRDPKPGILSNLIVWSICGLSLVVTSLIVFLAVPAPYNLAALGFILASRLIDWKILKDDK